MTTLIIGGNGKTGSQLAKILHDNGRPFLVASRKGVSSTDPSYPAVKFDWKDPSTFENPFQAAPDIVNLYFLILPSADEPDVVALSKPFLDFAVKKGLKKIVFLSSVASDKGGPYLGQVHQYIDGLGVPYAALRGGWFSDAFIEKHRKQIIAENIIASATRDGRISWVAPKDIAQAAYDAFYSNDEVWVNGRAPLIVGPEKLSYGQVATLLTDLLGRKIQHKRLIPGEPRFEWTEGFYDVPFQSFLEAAELAVADGTSEKDIDGASDVIVGKTTLREFLEGHKALLT